MATPLKPSARRISLLITDWDETVTSEDTLHLVARAAYDQKPGFWPRWDYFGEKYLADHAAHVEKYQPPECLNEIEKKLHYLNSLRSVEMQSVDRIEESRLFHEVTEDQIRAQHCHVPIRPYFFEVLKRAVAQDIPVCIVSVNWSAALMKEVLKQHGFNTDLIQVFANDVVMDTTTGSGTGKLSKSEKVALRTGVDKVRVIQDIINQQREKDPKISNQVFYFGDSSTDLPGMLAVNTGVIMANTRLRTTFESELGISVHDLDDQSPELESDPGVNRIYFINSWKEVLDNWI